MSVILGIFWTLVAATAQPAFIAALAGGAYGVKVLIEKINDRADERARKARCNT